MNDIHAQILRALESGSQENRWAAALALEGYVHESWALEQLAGLQGDGDSFVREIAARALGRQQGTLGFKGDTPSKSTSRSRAKETSSLIALDAASQFDPDSVRSMLERHVRSEPRIPIGRRIPQANSVDKIISVARFLGRDGSVAGTSWQAEISSRQVLYYRDAALWLGLLDDPNDNLEYLGDKLGLDSGTLFDRFGAISEAIIRTHPVVQLAVSSFLEDGRIPQINVFIRNLEQLHQTVSAEGAIPMGPSTTKRRLDTARAWTQWITSRIPTNV